MHRPPADPSGLSSTERGTGLLSLSPHPFPSSESPASASLRTSSGTSVSLTKPNTSCTIRKPASLRSDCCSGPARNPVRLPSGMLFAFAGMRSLGEPEEFST